MTGCVRDRIEAALTAITLSDGRAERIHLTRADLSRLNLEIDTDEPFFRGVGPPHCTYRHLPVWEIQGDRPSFIEHVTDGETSRFQIY